MTIPEIIANLNDRPEDPIQKICVAEFQNFCRGKITAQELDERMTALMLKMCEDGTFVRRGATAGERLSDDYWLGKIDLLQARQNEVKERLSGKDLASGAKEDASG